MVGTTSLPIHENHHPMSYTEKTTLQNSTTFNQPGPSLILNVSLIQRICLLL